MNQWNKGIDTYNDYRWKKKSDYRGKKLLEWKTEKNEKVQSLRVCKKLF